MVEGSNETLSKEEYEALVKGEGSGEEDAKDGVRAEDTSGAKDGAERSPEDKELANEKKSEPKRQQNVAEIGASKKRKQARVVLDEKDAEDKESQVATKSQAAAKKTKQKKKKKIKLSFAEEQE